MGTFTPRATVTQRTSTCSVGSAPIGGLAIAQTGTGDARTETPDADLHVFVAPDSRP